MHKATMIVVMSLIAAAPQAAFALKASDTMSDWTQATEQERSATLDEVLAKINKHGAVSRSDVLECLNRAAEVGGHGSLPIEDIVRACAEPPSGPAGSDDTGI